MTVRRWAPPLAWAVFIFVLTSLPGVLFAGIRAPTNTDKLVHCTMYAILGLLSARAALAARGRGRVVAIVLVAIAVLAALDEVHQHFIPGRTMDVRDWMADTIGATVGIMLAAMRRRDQESAA